MVIPGIRRPLVLCYHAISDGWPSELAVTSRRLEDQLARLLKAGWMPTTFTAAIAAPRSARVMAVTFDDGYRSTRERAGPILDRLGVPGTVFVATDFPGDGRPLSWPGLEEWLGGAHEDELTPLDWDDLRALSRTGWEVGSHGCSHPRLTEIGSHAVAAELEHSKEVIEREVDAPCTSLAYPYGDADVDVVEAARRAGYRAAAVLGSSPAAPGPLAIRRVDIYRDDRDWRVRAKMSPTLRRLATARARVPR
jgi:peptidoglycan/xylan/chitin deacetylase (PgdA/CDA1 family)